VRRETVTGQAFSPHNLCQQQSNILTDWLKHTFLSGKKQAKANRTYNKNLKMATTHGSSEHG
jgi:hypothetical protein